MAETLLNPFRVREKELLLNHLEFLRTHRGRVRLIDEAWCIESEKNEFTFAIPDCSSSVPALVSRYGRFYLKPSCLKFETELLSMGFKEKGGVNYLSLPTEDGGWQINSSIEVKRASTIKDFESFSEIQSKGFCESEEEYEEWKPFLHKANLKNFSNASQNFYIAYTDKKPVGVAIALFHKPLTGIYAVTTLPGFRRQGVSTALLNEIWKDSSHRGIEMLTLQASHGSYAEFFYQRLGFKSSFLVKIMSREKL